MRRAYVAKMWIDGVRTWHIHADSTAHAAQICTERDTWQEAMDHALETVGLAAPPEHREAP